MGVFTSTRDDRRGRTRGRSASAVRGRQACPPGPHSSADDTRRRAEPRGRPPCAPRRCASRGRLRARSSAKMGPFSSTGVGRNSSPALRGASRRLSARFGRRPPLRRLRPVARQPVTDHQRQDPGAGGQQERSPRQRRTRWSQRCGHGLSPPDSRHCTADPSCPYELDTPPGCTPRQRSFAPEGVAGRSSGRATVGNHLRVGTSQPYESRTRVLGRKGASRAEAASYSRRWSPPPTSFLPVLPEAEPSRRGPRRVTRGGSAMQLLQRKPGGAGGVAVVAALRARKHGERRSWRSSSFWLLVTALSAASVAGAVKASAGGDVRAASAVVGLHRVDTSGPRSLPPSGLLRGWPHGARLARAAPATSSTRGSRAPRHRGRSSGSPTWGFTDYRAAAGTCVRLLCGKLDLCSRALPQRHGGLDRDRRST